jgi:zinc/manganese transport system substrate-binding protein
MRSRIVPVLAVALVLAGCGGSNDDTAGDGCAVGRVVATTTVLGDVVASVVGDRADVDVLMPIGADPHGFEASAAQAAGLREAGLIVANGLDLEEGLTDVIEGAEADGVPVFRATDHVDLLPFGDHDEEGHGDGDGDGHEGTMDPHIWTDPARMAAVTGALGAALADLDPGCGNGWRTAAADEQEALLELDREVEDRLDAVPAEMRKLVTNHHSFGYFADRYGFEMIGVVVPGGSTLAEPSPADLADLVAAVEASGVPAVFAETTQPAVLARAVADELGRGVEVVTLYTGSLGEPGSGAETYEAMMLLDADRIAGALGG